MALSIHLPCEGSVRRTHSVVSACASGRASVNAQIFTEITITSIVDNHASHQVWVVILFVVDDGERLRLHTHSICDLLWRQTTVSGIIPPTKDTIIKFRLV